MSIKHKFIKNSFFNLVGWIWLVFLNIVTIPYIVHKLGYDAYGVYALVLMILGYFAFLDFGLCDAIIKYFSHYYTLKNFKKMNRILNSILFLYVVIGIMGGLGIILFTKFFALKLFKVPINLQPIAIYCFYCGSVGFFLNLVFSVISKIPEAIQRFDISNTNNVIVGSIVMLLNVLVLFLGFGLKEIILVNILGTVLGIVLFIIVSKKLIKELHFDFRFSFIDIKEVFNFGIYTIFTKFSSVIASSINQLFIGSIVGTAGVTIFNIPFKVVSRFNAFIFRIAFIVFPVSSELHAQAEHHKLQDVYLRLSRYLFLLSSIFFIPLMAYSKEFLHYWMGSQFAIQANYAMSISCLAFYLISWTMVPGLVALGLGKPNYNAAFSMLTAVINLGTVYPLTKAWGVSGAATSFFLSTLHVPLDIYIINKKIVQVDSIKYFKFVFGNQILIVILAILFFYFVLTKLIINGFCFLFVLCVSYSILFFLFYSIGLVKEDKESIRLKLLQYLG